MCHQDGAGFLRGTAPHAWEGSRAPPGRWRQPREKCVQASRRSFTCQENVIQVLGETNPHAQCLVEALRVVRAIERARQEGKIHVEGLVKMMLPQREPRECHLCQPVRWLLTVMMTRGQVARAPDIMGGMSC